MSIQEDLTLFNTGLRALHDTFEIVLDCEDKGVKALAAVKQALCVIAELLKEEEKVINVEPLAQVHDALKKLTYSVTEQFNGDAYHIIEAHLRTTPDELTLDQLVMLLNMCRIVKAGKEARLTVAQRAEIANLHPDFQAGATKKAQREVLSEIEKRLEYEHGKYASKAQLVKKKFETDVSYSREWLNKVTGFADAVFEQAPVVDNGLKMIDMFAGAGSFRLAFEAFGVKCVFSAENDKHAAQAYLYAHGDDPTCDINDIVTSELPEFDVLCAGFPCQPFSVAGLRKGFEDERARAALKCFEIIEERKPLGFILENVKGLATFDKQLGCSPLEKINNRLTTAGYHVEAHLLNAYEHGNVPQNRERYFITGIREDMYSGVYAPPVQMPTDKLHFSTVLEDTDVIDDKFILRREDRPRLSWAFEQLDEYAQEDDFAEYVYQIRSTAGKVRKHTVKGRSPALIKFMGMGGNNVPIIYDTRLNDWRAFTPRECMRLQGYSDTFKIDPKLSKGAIYRIVGNSIPVTLSKRVVESFLAAVEQAPAPVEQAPVEQAPAPVVEYLPDDIPAHYQEIAPATGEIEAYIDTLTFERVGVDSKGRCWRTPAPAFDLQPAPKKSNPFDVFMQK